MHYNHVSFDLWGTLIKPNPLYKEKRLQYLSKQHNQQDKTDEELAALIKAAEVIIDDVGLATGRSLHVHQIIAILLGTIGVKVASYSPRDLETIHQDLSVLFRDYPPQVYDNTVEVLTMFKDAGITMNILSNTGFILGSEIRDFLESRNMLDFFDFTLFSDEMVYCKPSQIVFQRMIELATLHRKTAVLKVLHVGDHEFLDYRPSILAGCEGFLINSNDKNILNAYNYVFG